MKIIINAPPGQVVEAAQEVVRNHHQIQGLGQRNGCGVRLGMGRAYYMWRTKAGVSIVAYDDKSANPVDGEKA